MTLLQFEAWNVRVLEAVTLRPSPGLTLVTGANASGKTSLLEALHILSTGRSFTSTPLERVVRYGTEALSVVGRVQRGERETILGLSRRGSGAPEIHIDRRRVTTLTQLAEQFPVQAIHPRSDDLVRAGPAYRRRYVDWGVFHVEHGFMPVWREYTRALGQRNAALRGGGDPRAMHAWDALLAQRGEQLSDYRERYLEALRPWVERSTARLLGAPRIVLTLSRGWGSGLSLSEALARATAQDRRTGQTSVGPHRAELRLRLDGHEVRAAASRGQQKLLVYTLKLAQVEHLVASVGRKALLLVDDLASELDAEARQRAVGLIRELGLQVIVTAIEAQQVPDLLAAGDCRVFHVEQGKLRELVY